MDIWIANTSLSAIRTAGLPRRIFMTIVILFMIAACVSVAVFEKQAGVALAMEIFAISLIGFSFVAWLSYDAALGWRYVDFPWVCSSFAAIVVALINISEVTNREQINSARLEINRAFSSLIYATSSVITDDCQELLTRSTMRERSPEPYNGACDRMKHFLPQMNFAYDDFGRSDDIQILRSWAMNMLVPDSTPNGPWSSQYEFARRFLAAAETYGPKLQPTSVSGHAHSRSSSLSHFGFMTYLPYWYLILAFFVGLRLSKTTAEVLQVRRSKQQIVSKR